MSHSIVVTVAVDFRSEINQLNNMKDELKECAGIYKVHFANELSALDSEIDKSINYIKSLEGMVVEQETLVGYQKDVSSLLKKLSNIKSGINYGEVYENLAIKDNEEINKIIIEYGVMAMFAIEDLKNSGEAINADTILKNIELNRQKEIESRQLDELLNSVKKRLILSDFPNEVKSEIVKLFNRSNTRQEVQDIHAYIETKIYEFRAMNELKETLKKALSNIGFEYKDISYTVNEEGEIVAHMRMFKDRTKDFVVHLKTNRQLDWQFGDYENHLCDADGDKFIEQIKELGVKMTSYNVTRNVSRSAPIRKAKELKYKEMK